MNRIDLPFGYFDRKSSGAGPVIASQSLGQPAWTPRRYDNFAKETYASNVIAYAAIKRRSEALASMPWYLQKNGADIDRHPLIDLLKRPNPTQAGPALFEAVEAFSAISGNAYLEAVRGSRSAPMEIYALRPDRMTMTPGRDGLPERWTYEVGGRQREWRSDPVTGRSEILHIKDFHPLNDFYGLAPTEPAAYAVDQHNSAAAHNQALLQNQARPSGAFVMSPPVVNGVSVPLSPDQLEYARERIVQNYVDPSRRGMPLVMGGDWKYVEMMMSPRELDFWEGSREMARQICTAYGVPHILVVPGESTYSNRENALLEFWESTVIPSARSIFAELSAWLSWLYGEDLALRYDEDQIPALQPRRREHRASVVSEWNAGLLSRDEAREALGWGKATDGGGDFRTSPPAQTIPAEARSRETKSADDLFEGLDDEMIRITQPEIEEALKAFGQGIFTEVAINGSFEVFDPAVQKFLAEYGATRIKQLVGTTTRKELAQALAQAVEDGATFRQQIERIQEVFSQAATKRAALIARTETVRSAGFGAVEGMRQAGIDEKEWLSTVDDRTRDDPGIASHLAMNGQRVPTDQEFTDPTTGDRALYPGGFGVAAQDIGCRCLTVAVRNGKSTPESERETKAKEIAETRDRLMSDAERRLETAFRIAFRAQERMVLERFRNTGDQTGFIG